ncbi:MAG: hypothetical protein RLW62_18880 [Gammaproteobacteria bacterium]
MRAYDTSPYEPVYRRLAAADGDGPRVIGLAGAGRGQGTTSLAVGLARAAAASGRAGVLVIDAAPVGRPAARLLARELRAPATDPGGLPGELQPGAHAAPALLSLDADRAAGVREDDWRRALASLRERYAVIVVDTGDVDSVVPLRWRAFVDTLVLVVDTNRETVESLSRLRKNLDDRALTCDGFVLNKRRFHVPGFLYRLVR